MLFDRRTIRRAGELGACQMTAVTEAVDAHIGSQAAFWGLCSTHLNVTICMTQGPEEVNVAVALLLPAVVTTLSSAISPSGAVMMRDLKPLPAARVVVATMFAPKINSFALVVFAEPLLDVALFPLAPAVTSTAVTPRYSSIRMSGEDRRLVEGHCHRIVPAHDVAQIVDRLSQCRPARRPDRQRVVVSPAVLHRLHRRRSVIPSHHHHVQVPSRLRSRVTHRYCSCRRLRRGRRHLHETDRHGPVVREPVGQISILSIDCHRHRHCARRMCRSRRRNRCAVYHHYVGRCRPAKRGCRSRGKVRPRDRHRGPARRRPVIRRYTRHRRHHHIGVPVRQTSRSGHSPSPLLSLRLHSRLASSP